MRRIHLRRALAIAGCATLFLLSTPQAQATVQPHIGYGFNVAFIDTVRVQAIGFDWIKLFDGAPCPERAAFNVLVRVEITGNTSVDAVRDKARALAESLQGCVEAFEIGNEPNLDASYGWAKAPIAADYVATLCAAYDEIKNVSMNYKVISAGLAPTGRVSGSWNGHAGHNGAFQDEREFAKEMFVAGAAACLDGVGYHPYGFSADYDVAPDVNSADAARRCINGFCFRGVEKIYELMQAYGLGDKQVWATEFGWIVEPPANCKNQPEWAGRLWQIVSEQKQADNLRGAFEYAHANWPWMGGMFVFNLNFNQAGWYDACEQMTFYSVADRASEAALTSLPKHPLVPTAALEVSQSSMTLMIDADDQPWTQVVSLRITNGGSLSMMWTAQVDNAAALKPVLSSSNGTLAAGASATLNITWTSTSHPNGAYHGTLHITAQPSDTLNAPLDIPLTLFVVEDVSKVYLPMTTR